MNVCKTSRSCISPILLILTIQYSFGIVFRNTPQDLDGLRDNSSVIVAGSVIQLFCSASGQFNAPRIQWTRNNVTIPDTAQLPHLMIKSRTENLLTTSTFVIAGFLGADNGSYGCLARETGTASLITSPQLLLTATESSGAIKIIRELSNGNSANLSGLYSDDRTYVALGSDASSGSFLRCSAEQPGPSSLGAPTMVWLKDGTQLFGDGVRVVINTNTSIAGSSNRTVSFVRIFNFSQSDAGVYQCVFYDTPSQGGEVITTRPYKVDTGPVYLNVTSPPIINLHPPDPLVIQVEAGGEYAGIEWMRTPVPLNASNGELVDFQQTFVRTVTTEVDWGLYNVRLVTTLAPFELNVDVTVHLNIFGRSHSSSSPLPSTIPKATSSNIPPTTSTNVTLTTIIIIAVPLCTVAGLFILVILIVIGMCLARWRCKEKDKAKVINPVFGKSDGRGTIDSTSRLVHYHDTDNNHSPVSPAPDPLLLPPPPPPPLSFGSYSQHIYDLMPSLSNAPPVFETLNDVGVGTGALPLHPIEETPVYSTPIDSQTLPGYAVLEESTVASRSPSPEKQELEYSYAAVRRTLKMSFDKNGAKTSSAHQDVDLQPNRLADSST